MLLESLASHHFQVRDKGNAHGLKNVVWDLIVNESRQRTFTVCHKIQSLKMSIFVPKQQIITFCKLERIMGSLNTRCGPLKRRQQVLGHKGKMEREMRAVFKWDGIH